MKVKTNSKQVREAIRSHLIEISQNDDIQIETTEEAVNYIVDKFYNEKIKHNKHYINNIRVINHQEIFNSWLNGLALNTYYTYNDIENYLNDLNVNYKEDEPEKTYYYLIFKEIKEKLYNLYYKVFEEVSEDD